MTQRLIQIAPWMAGLIAFCVYCYTLAPSVVHIDSGELAAVQATLGIAHPTGYPLFTLLGHAFLWLPIPGTVIYRLNLLCAVWCAGGVVVMGMIIRQVLHNATLFTKKQREKKTAYDETEIRLRLAATMLGGLFLGFSKTYWLQSTSVEVYSLHVFLLLLTIYFSISAYCSSLMHGPYSNQARQQWYVTAIVFGLGLSNHMSIIFVLSAIGFLFFSVHPLEKKLFGRLALLGTLSAVVVITLYSYIILRANNDATQLIWSLPKTFPELIRHIYGSQYSGLMFESVKVAEANLLNLIKSLPFEVAFGGILLSIIGLFYLGNELPRMFFFSVICIVINVVLSINYHIRDIYTYHLLTYVTMSFLGGIGIYALMLWTRTNVTFSLIAIFMIVFILSGQFYFNIRVSHRNLYAYEDYTKAILKSVEPNAIIIASQTLDWDLFVSPSIYYQYVEKERNDVVLLEASLLKTHWFHAQIERLHKGFFDPIRSSRESFDSQYLKTLQTWDSEDIKIWETEYKIFLNKIIRNYFGARPIYFSQAFMEYDFRKLSLQVPVSASIIPELLLYKLVPDTTYNPMNFDSIRIRFPEFRNNYILTMEVQIANVMYSRSQYESAFGNIDQSRYITAYRKRITPDIRK